MNIVIACEEFLVGDLEWLDGWIGDLPSEMILEIPHYLLDNGEEDELDEYIIETIYQKTGSRPLNSFSFEPV